MANITTKRLTIGIVGAGFTGTALASILHRLSAQPLEIILCDKSGRFGVGPAYSTPFPHHLLNVRAKDMSAFVDEPKHFTDWIKADPKRKKYLDNKTPIEEQFVPRCLYQQYLQDLLNALRSDVSGKLTIKFEAIEIIDIDINNEKPVLISKDKKIKVDKVVLALGNAPPTTFPFPVSKDVFSITNPWDYTALNQIEKQDPVLIVGTGLSMIDAVLTLHQQQHQGMIYAVSRHGLLPLPHSDVHYLYHLEETSLPKDLRALTKFLRTTCRIHVEKGGDWRSVMNVVRTHLPFIWGRSSLKDKKRFFRHLLPYWSIHRHRVDTGIMNLLIKLSNQKQLNILSGRILEVSQAVAKIKLRKSDQVTKIPIKWLINCMGPVQQIKAEKQPLVHGLLERKLATLDPLQMGFAIDSHCALKDEWGNVSTKLYAVGAPIKGIAWESGSVPSLRRQIFDLAGHLLAP